MRRAERLFRLVSAMRSRSISRADDLASLLEVSVRTVYRDIAHLQASGLPIEGEAGVGYLLRPGFTLPSMTFTHEQLDALAIGLSLVESLDDTSLAMAARETRAKIQANLPRPEAGQLSDAPYFSLRRRTGAPSAASLLRGAIRRRQIISLVYVNGEGHRSSRRVWPLAIWSFEKGWMFSAWCELRQTFRTFRFDRIAQVTMLDERFEYDEAKSLRAFLAQDACEQPL